MLKGYATPLEIASILGEDLSDETYMAQLPILLEMAEAAADDYTHTQFDWEEGVSKFFDGDGTGMITLGFYLRRLEAVYQIDPISGSRGFTVPDVVACPSPLKKGKAHRWVERRNWGGRNGYAGGYGLGSSFLEDGFQQKFIIGSQNYEVIGDWGFKPEEMPASLKFALAYIVKHMIDLRGYNHLVEIDAGLGRMVRYNRQALPNYIPEVAKSALRNLINSSAGGD